MEKARIIETIARERRVERIVATVFRTSLPLHGDAADLSQMIYLELLSRPGRELEQIWSSGDTARADRYLAGVVMKKITSRDSSYYRQIRRFNDNSRALTDAEMNIENGKN